MCIWRAGFLPLEAKVFHPWTGSMSKRVEDANTLSRGGITGEETWSIPMLARKLNPGAGINCNSHYLVSRAASDQIDAHSTGLDSWIFLMTMHPKASCHITSPHRVPLARVGVAVVADAPAPLLELLAVGFGVNDRVHQRSAGSSMTDQPD